MTVWPGGGRALGHAYAEHAQDTPSTDYRGSCGVGRPGDERTHRGRRRSPMISAPSVAARARCLCGGHQTVGGSGDGGGQFDLPPPRVCCRKRRKRPASVVTTEPRTRCHLGVEPRTYSIVVGRRFDRIFPHPLDDSVSDCLRASQPRPDLRSATYCDITVARHTLKRRRLAPTSPAATPG